MNPKVQRGQGSSTVKDSGDVSGAKIPAVGVPPGTEGVERAELETLSPEHAGRDTLRQPVDPDRIDAHPAFPTASAKPVWSAAPVAEGDKVPAQMRAWRVSGPNKLTLALVDTPVLKPGEVLVKVSAAGVNQVDAKTYKGAGVYSLQEKSGFTLGSDVAGTVVGKGGEGFEPGSRVFGMARFPTMGGTFAQYVAVPANQLAPVPSSLAEQPVKAAGLPLVSLTAWQAIHRHADVKPGQRVLIHGAGGAVGQLAAQFAKLAGATVIGTASPQSARKLTDAGVDEIIDYTSQDFAQRLQGAGVDVVIDTIGGDTQARSWGVLKERGVLVALSGPAPVAPEGKRSVRMSVEPDAPALKEIGRLIDEGKVRALDVEAFGFDELGIALASFGGNKRKPVLVTDE